MQTNTQGNPTATFIVSMKKYQRGMKHRKFVLQKQREHDCPFSPMKRSWQWCRIFSLKQEFGLEARMLTAKENGFGPLGMEAKGISLSQFLGHRTNPLEESDKIA